MRTSCSAICLKVGGNTSFGGPPQRLRPRKEYLQHHSGVANRLLVKRFLFMQRRTWVIPFSFVATQHCAADRGVRVIVECQPELLGLLRSISQISTLVRPSETLPAFDFQIPMMSLPVAFETSLENIPSTTPYLHPDPARVLDWKSRLGKLGSPRNIGLVWAGGEKHPSNEKRSMHLSQFAPLAELTGISWISLKRPPIRTTRSSAFSCFGLDI